MNTHTAWIVEAGERGDRHIVGVFDDKEMARKFAEAGPYDDVFPVQVNAYAEAISAGLGIFTIIFSVSRGSYRCSNGQSFYDGEAPGCLVINGDTSGGIVLFSESAEAAVEKAKDIIDRAMKKFFTGKMLVLRVLPNGDVIDPRSYQEPWW